MSKIIYINEIHLKLLSENYFDKDFYEISQIRHDGVSYVWNDFEVAVPFFILPNGKTWLGRKGTTHSDYSYLFDEIVGIGRIWFVDDDTIIFVVGSWDYDGKLSDSEVISSVKEICGRKGYDENKVYYVNDLSISVNRKLNKLVGINRSDDEIDKLDSRYKELSKRRGDELEASWRARMYQESKLFKKEKI